jgi:hypothetical protein
VEYFNKELIMIKGSYSPVKFSNLTTVFEKRETNVSSDINYDFNRNCLSPYIYSLSPSPPTSPSTSPSRIETDDEIIDRTIKNLSKEKIKETQNTLNDPNKVLKPLSYLYKEPAIKPSLESKKSTSSSKITTVESSNVDNVSKSNLVDIPKSTKPPMQPKKYLLVRKLLIQIAINIPIIITGIIMFFLCTNPFTGIPFIIIVLAYVIITRLLVYLILRIINYLSDIVKNSKVISE